MCGLKKYLYDLTQSQSILFLSFGTFMIEHGYTWIAARDMFETHKLNGHLMTGYSLRSKYTTSHLIK